MSQDVCEPRLRDWSKLCTEVLPIVPVPATHATATIPPSIWLTQSGRFLLPFMSCWKPPSLALNFSSVRLSTSSKAATGAAWYGWGWGIWMKDWEEKKKKERGGRKRGDRNTWQLSFEVYTYSLTLKSAHQKKVGSHLYTLIQTHMAEFLSFGVPNYGHLIICWVISLA